MLFGATADFFSENYCLVKTTRWVGRYMHGVRRGGRRKRVAEWSEDRNEQMNGQFFVEIDFPYPHTPQRKSISVSRKEKAGVAKNQFRKKLPH